MDNKHWFHVWWNIKMMEMEHKLTNLWWRIWNKRLRLWWHRLWLRRNEFDKSLNNDRLAMQVMTEEEQVQYRNDLMHRRWLAHLRDEAEEDEKYARMEEKNEKHS